MIHDAVLLQKTFRISTHQYKKIRELTFNKNNIPSNIQLTELKGSVRYLHFCFLNNQPFDNKSSIKVFRKSEDTTMFNSTTKAQYKKTYSLS